MIRSIIASLTPPSLHNTEPEPERHATWLELFFDLVFVVAVAELVHLLEANHSVIGLLEFAALFVPIWWTWITFSYYGDIFDDGDVVYPLASLAAMFGVVIWSTTFEGVLSGGSAAFALGYLALRGLNTAQFAFVGRVVPGAKTLAQRYALGYSAGLIFWVIGFFVPEPFRYVLWGLGITIEILSSPVIYVLYDFEDLPRQRSHMDERFGLFTIVVLGETVVAVANGATGIELGVETGFAAVSGFVAAVCFWWLYFGYFDVSSINRFLQSDTRGLARSFIYGYGHLLVFASIAAGGVAIALILEATAAGELLTADERLIVGAAAGVYLLGVAIVHWASPLAIPDSILAARLIVAGITVAVALAGGGLSPVTVGGLVALLFVGLVTFEVSRSGRAVATLETEL